MNMILDKQGSDPAYIQLYRHLVKDITEGVYPYGTKLPSKRVIAEDTGVSVITVEHALDLLTEEGYTRTVQRSGVFVDYRGEDFLGEKRKEETIDLGEEGEREGLSMDFGEFPFSVLAKVMRKTLLDQGENILVKSPNHGCAALRSEICKYLARSRGITISPSQVIVGSGAE
ncbi:MAG: GntR family transcriptional regulator, partial [Clostridiales bacterium]|nr:GntR family transcriptional regulator [Clostridiales bacterium]